MKSIKKTVLALVATSALALAFASCTSYRPVSAGSGSVGAKRGEATASYLFGLPLGQDNTMLAAANAGGIKHVGTVDQKVFSVLGLYTTVTTIVGEE